MLGVTLFGLVLTPVFFNTIDWLGESRLFRSPAALWIGRFSLDVLRLGFVWRTIRGTFSRITAPSKSIDREAQPSAIDIEKARSFHDVNIVSSNGNGKPTDNSARPPLPPLPQVGRDYRTRDE